MKRLTYFCLWVIMGLYSCGKRTIPSVSITPKVPIPSTSITEPELSSAITVNPVTIYNNPLIVISEKGEIITTKDRLPEDIAAKVDYNQIARSFTPTQRANLISRFKIVPPRVIYVPAKLVQQPAKGFYCIYKKKFWYWRKPDGLFYLDETYYQ